MIARRLLCVAALAAAVSGCGIAGRAVLPSLRNAGPSSAAGCRPSPDVVTLIGDERLWADVAWRYLDANVTPATGIVAATAGRPIATMWDVSDQIAATYAAHELGLIDSCAFDLRFGRIVGFLNSLPLVDDIAPNRWYRTTDMTMVDGAGQPAVIGWSALDLGRLLGWLRAVEIRHPMWSEYIGRAVARWNYCPIVGATGSLSSGVHTGPDANTSTSDLGLGYEEYAAAGFAAWGFDVARALQVEPAEAVVVEGISLRRDQRDRQSSNVVAPLTTTPFAAFEMEFGDTAASWTPYRTLGRAVAQTQYRRLQNAYTLTARSSRPLARAPWFVHDSVWAEGYGWNTVDATGAPAAGLALVSTAAAFELWAVYPDEAADRVLASILALKDPQRGWYAGRFERTGASDETLALRTNAAVLQALLFRHAGVLNRQRDQPSWFDQNRRDEFFRPGRCLPGEPRRSVVRPPVSSGSRAGLLRFMQQVGQEPERRPRGLNLSIGVDVPLAYGTEAAVNRSQGLQSPRSARLGIAVHYAPRQTWFARVAAFTYLDQARQRPWNPDFTYHFGYDNWRSNTLVLRYDNYGGNRFTPDRDAGEKVSRPEEGTITFGYKIPVPRGIEAIFVPRPDNRISLGINYHLTPRFHTQEGGARRMWKQSVSLGLRNRLFSWFFGEFRAFYYPRPSQQQPWDPDFTYAFGYSDWHPGTVSVVYGNYSGNRFGWNNRRGDGRFRDGSISIWYTGTW